MSCKTIHKGKYYVSFKRAFEDCKKDITVTIDRVLETDSLKIVLSDDEDPTFLCVLTVTRNDYEDLKRQQGLLIDFDNFPSQLVRLLQQCATNNMFLQMQQTNPIQCFFEIVEHNEFKRLVHLSLKTAPATDSDIKQHMADSIHNLKKTLSSLKSMSSSTEAILNDKCINYERKIQDLSHALGKMEEDKIRSESEHQETLKQEKDRLAQELLHWKKTFEMNNKAQLTSSQETINRKDTQIDELNSLCKQLKENINQLEYQVSDKNQRLHMLEAEVQKTHIEVATLKAKNTNLDKDIIEKDKLYHHLTTKCTQLEKTIKDYSETIKELNHSLLIIKKEKTSLEEKLNLSESLKMKNNEAAHTSAEQLLKANQIISKQNSDLMEMKEKLLCRTAIALEQEKVIEKNTKEIEELKLEINHAQQKINKVENELETIKQKYEANELVLKDKDETIKNNNMVIQWLHKKMESSSAPNDMQSSSRDNPTAVSSTPYFLSRNNQNFTNSSDESINFYATSKLSNMEDSPQSNVKHGLDPKYLQPASDDNRTRNIDTARTKSVDMARQLGKENKNIELPKVDYREKKSSRSSTYRPTPASAYFP